MYDYILPYSILSATHSALGIDPHPISTTTHNHPPSVVTKYPAYLADDFGNGWVGQPVHYHNVRQEYRTNHVITNAD